MQKSMSMEWNIMHYIRYQCCKSFEQSQLYKLSSNGTEHQNQRINYTVQRVVMKESRCDQGVAGVWYDGQSSHQGIWEHPECQPDPGSIPQP